MTPESDRTDKSPLDGVSLSPRIGMPRRLVVVRHGESQGNVITRAVKRGILSEYPQGFAEIPDREFRLSGKGREQARISGIWLSRQYPEGFDVIYVSDHIRARETAAIACQEAGWHNAQIRIDPQLGERSWGGFSELAQAEREKILEMRKRDPLHVGMPQGELLLHTRERARILLGRALREFSGQRVMVFSHGEFIEAFWAEVAHMTTEAQVSFFMSEAGNIRNCQVVEFSGEDPFTGEWNGKLRWVRSSCPFADVDGDWMAIESKKYTPEELLRSVEHYPQLSFPGIDPGDTWTQGGEPGTTRGS